MSGCEQVDEAYIDTLVVQELITDSEFSPPDGIGIDEALSIVSDYLKYEAGVKGDFENQIVFKEITTKALWDNSKQQVYRVSVSYAWLDGVAIFENGDLIKLLWGQDLLSVIAADLDSDGLYEICMNSNFGSGFVISGVYVYDSGTGVEYKFKNSGENRDIWDITIQANDDKTEVCVYGNKMNGTKGSEKLLGNLKIDENMLKVIE